jgi:subtilisin family serine protease
MNREILVRTGSALLALFMVLAYAAPLAAAWSHPAQHLAGYGGYAPWIAKIDPAILEKVQNAKPGEYVEVVIRLQPLPQTIAENVKGHYKAAVNSLKSWARATQEPIVMYIAKHRGVVLHRFWLDNVILARVPAHLVYDLAKNPMVVRIFPNFKVHVLDAVEKKPVNVKPGQEVESWGIFKIEAPQAWQLGYTGEGVRIAVLDTGVDANHPALQGKMLTLDPNDPHYPGGWMEFDQNGNPVCSEPHDTHGHGTHTSGTALGGDTENILIGVAPGATLMHGLVLPGGSGTFAQVLAGMEWTVDPYDCNGNPTGLPAHVVSMSWGASGYYGNDLLPPIKDMLLADIIPVAAIGNDGPYTSSNPGNIWGVFGIGATDQDDNVASWSSGEVVNWPSPPEDWPFFDTYPSTYVKPDFSAPGVGITSSVPGGGYEAWSGTSMATPHVSGTVALILQAMGALDFDVPDLPELVYQILNASSVDLGNPGQDIRYGWGRIDAYQAVELAQQYAKHTGVQGYVLDAVDQSPVTWATVTVEQLNKTVGVNEEGFFKIPLDPGNYTLLFHAWGYQDLEVNVTVVELNGTIAGFVFNAVTGEPIQGAVVTAVEANVSAVTDENGWFQLSVEPGTYTVMAEAEGFYPAEQQISVDENETVLISFNLIPTQPGTIYGYVFDANTSEPIQGATIVAVGPMGAFNTTTDENGYYELEVPAGDYEIHAYALGYEAGEANVSVVPGGSVEVNFTLEPIPPAVVVIGDSYGHEVEILEEAGFNVVVYDNVDDFLSDLESGNVYPAVVVIDHWYSEGDLPDEDVVMETLSLAFSGVSIILLDTSYAGITGGKGVYYYNDDVENQFGIPAPDEYEYGYPDASEVKVNLTGEGIEHPIFQGVPLDGDTWFYLADLDESTYADYLAWEFTDDNASQFTVLADIVSGTEDEGYAVVVVNTTPAPIIYMASWAESSWMQYLEPGSDGMYSDSTLQSLVNAVAFALQESSPGTLPMAVARHVSVEGGVGAEVYTNITVYLERQPYGYVAGHVVGSDGVELAGAQISVVGTPVSATAGEHGYFQFWLPAGEYTLLIAYPGYADTLVNVTVEVNETTNLGDVVLQRIPRIAILYDYAGEIKAFLETLGYYAKDFNDPMEIADAISTGFYDAAIWAGHYEVPFPSQDEFNTFVNAAEQAGISVVWLDNWGGYSYGFGYGITVLSYYTGDPACVEDAWGTIPYAHILEKHLITRGFNVGDIVQLNNDPASDFSWFCQFSGDVVANLYIQGYGDVGNLIGYKVLPDGRKYVLLASMAPEEWTDMSAWTQAAFDLLGNAVLFAIQKPVNVTVEPGQAKVGDTVEIQISGAPANTEFNVTFNGQLIGVVTTDENGTAELSFTVPTVPGGVYLVEAMSTDYRYYGMAHLEVVAAIYIEPASVESQPAMLVVYGNGFYANETVDLYLDGNWLSVVVAGEDGTFNVTLNLPIIVVGDHYIKAFGAGTASLRASAEFHVASEPFSQILGAIGVINGSVSTITGQVAEIVTSTGNTIKAEISQLNASLAGLVETKSGEILGVINTSYGQLLVNLDDLAKLVNQSIVEIHTAKGDILVNLTALVNGKASSLQDAIVNTVNSKAGEIESAIDNAKNDVINAIQGLQQNITSLSSKVHEASSNASTAKNLGAAGTALGLIALAAAAVAIARKGV